MMSVQIACACGEIALEVVGAPVAELYCHCRDCQVVHGAAFVPVRVFKRDQVRLARGTPRKWQLRTTPRWTCANCGTRILAEGGPAIYGVTATLFPREQFRPTLHIHCESALSPVADDMPHYATLPEAFGGNGQLVEW